MKIIKKTDCPVTQLPGRNLQKIIGKESFSESKKITFGLATFSFDLGLPEPHQHAEEICYVLNCRNAYIHYGPAADKMGDLFSLEAGMSLHIPELEWHQFVCQEGGFADILFIYGQVENIRPEEIIKGQQK